MFVVYNSSFTGVQQKLSMDHVDSSAVPGDPQCRAVWVLSRGKQDPHCKVPYGNTDSFTALHLGRSWGRAELAKAYVAHGRFRGLR